MFPKSLLSTVLYGILLLCSAAVFAQKENHIWYAPYVSLDFNAVPAPALIPPPAIPSNGQPASICDSLGNLLFYTNGNRIYGKDHLPMPNGLLLDGYESRFNLHPCSALILPKGGSQYYLFSLLPDSLSVNLPPLAPADYMVHPSLYYSIIDMQRNGGNGDIVPGSKNLLLKREVMRGFLVASRGPGCDSMWVAVHDIQAPVFLTYPVTAAGVGSPVSSATGLNFLPDNEPGYGFYYGKFSTDYSRIAMFSWRRSIAMPFDPGVYASLELIDFNKATGTFSNAASLYENLDFSPFLYGFFPMSFSPDSKKLYTVQRTDYDVATWNKVVQYDLSAPTLAGIRSSETVVGTIPPVGQGSAPFVTDMRLAPDQKIYIACGDIFPMSTGGIIPLARINAPDASGLASGFESGLASPLLQKGFPMLFPVNNTERGGAITAATNTKRLCSNSPAVIGASQSGSYLWSNGSTDSSITVNETGSYWVRITNACNQHTDTFFLQPPLPLRLLPEDTIVCAGSQWLLTLPVYPDVQYTWQDGSTANTYPVSREGSYSVTVHSPCGTLQDLMQVTYGNCNCDHLFVPNAFSPNADGINDVFLPRYPCSGNLQPYELKVYNRWGQTAFTSHMPGQGWNGTMDGQPVETGVYHYTVKFHAEGRQEELFTSGQVTLLR